MALLAFVFAATWFVTGAMAAHLPGLLQAGGASPAAAVTAAALVGPAQVAGRILEFTVLRQGLLGAPSRLAQAAAPFVFGLLIACYGTAAIGVSIALSLAALAALCLIRPAPSAAPAAPTARLGG